MATIKNVNDYYIRSDGSYTEDTNNSGVFYPNSNYSNLLRIYLEDGISENTFVQVNFLIEGKYVTEWLPLFLGTETTKDINGTLITFTEFKMLVPGTVLQNASPNETKTIGLSVRMVYTDSWDGVYTDIDELDDEYDLTDPAEDTETYVSLGEEMADNYALAYCVQDTGEDTEDKGFYQVQLNAETEDYEWTAVELPDSYAETKGYAVGNATLQKGFVNPKGTITTSELVVNAIFVELSNIEQDVSTNTTAIADLDTNKLEKDFTAYNAKTTYSDADTIAINDNEVVSNPPKRVEISNLMKAENMSFDNSGTSLDDDFVQDAIESVQTNVETVQTNLDDHEGELAVNIHNESATTIPFTPSVDPAIASETVQDAIEEVQTNLDTNIENIPIDKLYDFGTTASFEYMLYLLITHSSSFLIFHGRLTADGDDVYVWGIAKEVGGGILHATIIYPNEVKIVVYDATIGASGTVTSLKSFATIESDISEGDSALDTAKIDKLLTAYSALSSLSDSQRIYIDSSGTAKYTTVAVLKSHIASDFVSFGYVIATEVDENGLPVVAEPLTNKVYLVEIAGEEEANNIHNEFIYVDGSWELLGTTQLNLDDIVLSADVTSDGDIGFIEQDQTVSSGTTFQQFVELLLSETYTTQYPTLVAPSVALSVDTVAVVESGTETDVELTATFNAGSIRGDMVGGSWSSSTVQDDRAGDITSYELGVDGFEVDTALINTRTMSSYRFDDGNNIFSVIVNYGIGAQPLDSDGENYGGPLSAGSVEKTRTITGARKLFYGHTNDGLTSSDIRSLESSVLNPSNGTAFTIQVPIGATSVVFAYPATLRSVTSVHQVGVGTALSQFTETEVDVRSAYDDASSEMAYRVYTFEPAEAYLTEESYEVTI